MKQEQAADHEVRLEKFRLLQQTLPQSISFGALLTLVVVAVLWRKQDSGLLLAWLAAQAVLSGWRWSVLRRFRRLQEDAARALRLAPVIQLGCALSGVLWGTLVVLPYGPDDDNTLLFVSFVLAGVTAGGATAMASELVAALTFQFAIFGLCAIRLLLSDGSATHQAMGLSALLYTLFMALWTGRMHWNALAAIRRQLDSTEREQQLQRREGRYRELAHADTLTGLPNRLSLQSRLPELLQQAAMDQRTVAVIYMDLDRFKDINDLRGHRCGDALLQSVARRLRDCVRATDLVVRMGGDEFIVATTEAQRRDEIAALASRLATSVGLPLLYDGEALKTSASMGIAIAPEHGTDTEQLLKSADIALYQAKADGRGRYRFFADEMGVALRERIFLEQELAKAVGTDQLRVEYQPLVELSSGRWIALEALLRWQHPERGMVPPPDFIPIAEQCGLIEVLGTEVLRMVAADLRGWQRAGVPLLPVAVNISPIQFEQPTLVDSLLRTARAYDIDPRLLQIEITETALMKDTGEGAATLRRLREHGVSVFIDDFGIGFSSLNHLKNLAIDGLKIDRSFVRDMIEDERDGAIVSAIIGIGRNLGIDVVAEGVDSAAHVQRLLGLGCSRGQGHFWHEPLLAAQCTLLLGQQENAEVAGGGSSRPRLHG
jgi:diguanylate cyclase (GGDEF)-like protein